MFPMEGAAWSPIRDQRLRFLTVITSTQFPHSVQTGLCECLGLDDGAVRIISPDVGGGFGYKGVLCREEVALGMAGVAGRPSGSLAGGLPRASHRQRELPRASLRDHRRMRSRTASCWRSTASGYVDAGAYSDYPISSAPEAAQIANLLPGPYDLLDLSDAARTRSPRTSARSSPIAASRASGVCLAIEVVMDAHCPRGGDRAVRGAAAQYGASGADAVRQRGGTSISTAAITPNACAAPSTPFASAKCAPARSNAEPDGRLIGVGLSFFVEQGAHGTVGAGVMGPPDRARATSRRTFGSLRTATSRSASEPIRMVRATKRPSPRSRTRFWEWISNASRCSRATRCTRLTRPRTWGSRSMVHGRWRGRARIAHGRRARCGASARGCCRRMPPRSSCGWAASLPDNGSVTLREVARAWYLQPQNLPPDVDSGGLEVDGGLPRRARQRHVQLCRLTPPSWPSIPQTGIDRDTGLCRGRRRRRARQSDDCRRPGLRRHGAGHRHLSVRGDAVRRTGTAARLHAARLHVAGGDGSAGHSRPAHADAFALHRVRHEGYWAKAARSGLPRRSSRQ